MFELNLNESELEAFDNLIKTCVDSEGHILPSWDYMGQNVWEMNFDGDAAEVASKWAIETADVA